MAENNRNQFSRNDSSSKDWEQNRNRLNQANDSRENYDSYGNASFRNDDNQANWRNRNFQQQNRGADWRNQQKNQRDQVNQEQVNYVPDNEDNRGYNQAYDQNNNRQRYNSQRGEQEDRNYTDQWQKTQRRNNQFRNQDWEANRESVNYEDQQRSGYSYEGRNYGDYRYGTDDQKQINNLRNRSEHTTGDRDYDRSSSRTSNVNEYRRTEDRGQTGEHRGKGPRGYQRSKERIHEDICDRLTYDDRLDASEIDVKVEDNEVILTGTVTTREEKRRAEDLAESIAGVQNVQNRLRIAPPDVGTTETTNTIIRKTGNMSDQGAERL